VTDASVPGLLAINEIIYKTQCHDRQLRFIVIDKQPWFLAIDACRASGCRMDRVFDLVHRDDRLWLDTASLPANSALKQDDTWFLTEVGLNAIVYGPDSYLDHDFKRWLTLEALPMVRDVRRPSIHKSQIPIRIAEIVPRRLKTKRAEPAKRTPHALYRFYASGGRLLYVGITLNLSSRFQTHRAIQPWWKHVTDIRIESYPTRRAVLRAETIAIQTENPMHNVVGKLA
jgi:prophage antirepressor-like protein/predicted GIY-YIG superfamily endonuclease